MEPIKGSRRCSLNLPWPPGYYTNTLKHDFYLKVNQDVNLPYQLKGWVRKTKYPKMIKKQTIIIKYIGIYHCWPHASGASIRQHTRLCSKVFGHSYHITVVISNITTIQLTSMFRALHLFKGSCPLFVAMLLNIDVHGPGTPKSTTFSVGGVFGDIENISVSVYYLQFSYAIYCFR